MNRDKTNSAATDRTEFYPAHAHAVICGVALAASDVLAIAVAGHVFNGPGAWPGSHLFERFDHAPVAAFIAAALAILRFAALRHYSNRLPMLRELRELFGTLIFGCACHVGLLLLRGYAAEIVPAVLMWVYAAALVPPARLAVKLGLMKMRFWQRDLYVIGSGQLALDAATAVETELLMGLALKAFVPAGKSLLPRDARVASLSPLDAPSLAGSVVMVALDRDDAVLQQAWLRALGSVAASVVLVADVPGVPLHGMRTTYVKSHELLLMQVRDNLSRWHVRFFKRCLDLAGAISISMMLAPFLLYIAWQVRKDGGRAIYGHPRIGHNGRPFNCYKFRSMVVDANAKLAELLERDPEAKRDWERDFKLKNDPRVTRIGSFLRRTSLDELPQLWNVIRGDMSLVGPRPIVQAELERYAADVPYYLMARPGMTGLWQVSGRNDADYTTRVYLDAWYVRNWSLWYDIAILFMTVRTVFKRDGAY
ncbi:Bacterial sugar transferase [Caballeronia sp. SBC1]|uniref:undecaprenyl-phosphate galactose phosphotransferase WbaP n=1 Tax=Caballeronia sp. SBC1 TaxID=2705548 RepID=UPI001407C0CD|nr:undecaprenyl-phosphate galactose phosphotransferase WbaP [Caballeronia sp. SBC1]QIN63423.1 Bacterial sugar transferase [Caballeronia sp. SBC1]